MNIVPLKVKYLPSIIFHIIMSYDVTAKVTKVNEPVNIEGPKIFASWHGRQYCFLHMTDRSKLSLLISKSNDGEIITTVVKRMGFNVIRGSASRGGMTAVRHMLEALNNGTSVAFTVDGPRGPIYDVKIGLIKLAQMSGAPIIPIVPATRTRIIVFSSWDKYNLPFYFSNIHYHYGDPIYIDKDADDEQLEQYRLQVRDAMRNITFEADKSKKTVEKEFLDLAKFDEVL